jgi:hypothetical protein
MMTGMERANNIFIAPRPGKPGRYIGMPYQMLPVREAFFLAVRGAD